MRSRRASTGCDGRGPLRIATAKVRDRKRSTWRSALGAAFPQRLFDARGQSTVEYALVVFALLAVFVACAVIWKALESGLFVAHAAAGASHHVGGASLGAVADVLLY